MGTNRRPQDTCCHHCTRPRYHRRHLKSQSSLLDGGERAGTRTVMGHQKLNLYFLVKDMGGHGIPIHLNGKLICFEKFSAHLRAHPTAFQKPLADSEKVTPDLVKSTTTLQEMQKEGIVRLRQGLNSPLESVMMRQGLGRPAAEQAAKKTNARKSTDDDDDDDDDDDEIETPRKRQKHLANCRKALRALDEMYKGEGFLSEAERTPAPPSNASRAALVPSSRAEAHQMIADLHRWLADPPILVVCQSYHESQWSAEIYTHIDIDGSGLRIGVLQAQPHKDISTEWMMNNYDIIIVSSSYVAQRYEEIKAHARFYELVHATSRSYAVEQHRQTPQVIETPEATLPFRFCDLPPVHNLSFSVMILDESHQAKNPDTLIHQAIRSLPYEKAILITATPQFNKTEDWCGQFMLLAKGGIVDNLGHSQHLLMPKKPAETDDAPERQDLSRLQEVLAMLVLGRSKIFLDLPGIEYHVQETAREILADHILLNRWLVQKARKCFRGRDLANENGLSKVGYAYIAHAQKVASMPQAISYASAKASQETDSDVRLQKMISRDMELISLALNEMREGKAEAHDGSSSSEDPSESYDGVMDMDMGLGDEEPVLELHESRPRFRSSARRRRKSPTAARHPPSRERRGPDSRPSGQPDE
ncbi:uncharacterized protein F5Z01DRAFT_690877 [Emericellopsis atlantica]|uniref:SNF2 N-terminal domain-containing protein n=1 Tax=Emericellopsis atlantica TaxID=2614577 RepID=A0A9P7ZHF0_9HYPO|nr:uncharacterized protein F5Z01DRAFT_690877 [Emericellopsis atlantica]KAG9252169.1 hypothetical protein F5Z01DRAFT_690877 [Emericellopsis atlantica]